MLVKNDYLTMYFICYVNRARKTYVPTYNIRVDVISCKLNEASPSSYTLV